MQEQTKSSLFLTRYFHILHLCMSLGLVIVVVYNQITNNSRFEKFENEIFSLKKQSNGKIYGVRPAEETSFESRHFRAKRGAVRMTKRSAETNLASLENKFENNTHSRQFKEGVEDKKKGLLMCLDMMRDFVKINSSQLLSEMNVCTQLRGPPGKQGPRGQRGKTGKRGARGHKGKTGKKGIIGKHGPPGPRGEKGFSGNVTVIGLKGDSGIKGDKGSKGDQGIDGQQGIKGDKGDFGGPKGDRGEPGAKGEIGPRGCRGESFAPPQFNPSSRNLVFTEIETATLFCNATANPYSHITWFRNDVEITAGGRYAIEKNVSVPSALHSRLCNVRVHPFTQSSLVIKQSRNTDTGNYFCEARNVMGVFRFEINLLIQVYVQFTTFPSNITVVEKDNVRLSCRASGVPSPLITWQRKDGGRMPSVYRVVSGDLYITGITKEEEGVYQCIASNVLGSRTTDATITVNVFPVISYFAEEVITINESQTLHLPCNATGFPEPQITWNKTEDYLPDNRTTYNSQHLNVSDVRYEDGGEYVCMANNILGNVSKRTTVVVQAAPKILERPDATEYGYRGYNKTLEFKVFSFPPASVEWMKDEKRIDQVSLENYSLILESVEYNDSGSYQAIASNILGEVKVSTFLIIRDPVPPSIISQISQSRLSRRCGSRLPLHECRVLGNPSPTIVWKHNDKILKTGTGGSLTLNISNIQPRHAGRYTCEASNSFGEARQHFTLDVPVSTDVHTSCNHQRLDRSSGRITSPGYPGNYKDSQACSWQLRSTCRIMIQFESFNTESGYDYVRVYNGSSDSSPLIGKYHGTSLPENITSSEHQLYITFKSDSSNVRKGFSLKYEQADTD